MTEAKACETNLNFLLSLDEKEPENVPVPKKSTVVSVLSKAMFGDIQLKWKNRGEWMMTLKLITTIDES